MERRLSATRGALRARPSDRNSASWRSSGTTEISEMSSVQGRPGSCGVRGGSGLDVPDTYLQFSRNSSSDTVARIPQDRTTLAAASVESQPMIRRSQSMVGGSGPDERARAGLGRNRGLRRSSSIADDRIFPDRSDPHTGFGTPPSGNPPLQLTVGSYRRRSSGSPAINEGLPLAPTPEGSSFSPAAGPMRPSSVRKLQPTTPLPRGASDRVANSSRPPRRRLSRSDANDSSQLKPRSRSDLGASSSERVLSAANDAIPARPFTSFRGEKWGERRVPAAAVSNATQEPNRLRGISSEMAANGQVSLRGSLLHLATEGATDTSGQQPPWQRVDAIELVVDKLFSTPKYVLGKYESQAMADSVLQNSGLSAQETEKLHSIFQSFASLGRWDPYDAKLSKKPSSSTGIGGEKFLSLSRAAGLVDGKIITTSVLQNIFVAYRDQDTKLLTYPQFILLLGDVMELIFWPLKHILRSIICIQPFS
mmetsp:Transcript_7304/g.20605  ORF Transcript_7304/g.20605 Transcript_7304/m.20605 type:complete len:479 (-) Transcript_7304:1289-2725(-)